MRVDAVMDCHVLVIGSGGAGVQAAIEVSHCDDTVRVSKTLTGKGGCTKRAAGGYNAVMQEAEA
ncbi:MAG: FAD-binding protein [Methanoregula sp.]|jgi:fumarate reductase (CoM/CoB) subunit A